ncbi:hypothetical protein BW716_05925 [[Flexibacter] sp. ATCC 35208]|nr:hypothetical protein BW716_05925 [[Flexibacter] sp. ATCC 35208]
MIRSLFKFLKFAGASELPEYEIKKSICTGVNVLCICVIVLNAITGPIFYTLSGDILIFIGAYLEAIVVFGVIWLNKMKKYTIANFVFYLIISLSTFYFSAVLGRVSESQLMILFLFGLIFFLFNDRKLRLYCIVLNILLLIAIELNGDLHFIPAAKFPVFVEHIIRWLVYVVVISLTLMIFNLYDRNTILLISLHSYSKTISASLNSEEESNRVKNLLFQHISHDLRGPYFGVLTRCYYLQSKRLQEQPITVSDIEKLVDVANHYKYMLEHFMEMSRFKNADFNKIEIASIDLRAELAKIIEMHKYPASQNKLTVSLIVSPDFPTFILTDKIKICRIIHNLLSNAIKFTRPNTRITIAAEVRSDKWVLIIKDQGHGISNKTVEQLFQPYVTEKSPANPEGVGLGLFITKHLVTILGAEISVASKLNEGTMFEIVFPYERRLSPI